MIRRKSLILRLYSKSVEKNDLLEVIWEYSSNNPVEIGKKIPVASIQEFLNSWRALLNRFLAIPTGLSDLSTEAETCIRKKSEWLSNELGWSHFLDQNSKIDFDRVIIISDPDFTSIPVEILPFKEKYICDYALIMRKIKLSKNPPCGKKGNGKLFVFQSGKNPLMNESIQNEKNKIHFGLRWKKEPTVILQDNCAVATRFQEEISVARTFHYAGHIEKNRIPLANEDYIGVNEISDWNLSQLDVVFLNGCHSAFQDTNTIGSAGAFLQAGVKEVIGFSESIPTSEAEKTGIHFWREYQKSGSTEKAFLAAKRKIADSIFRFTFFRFAVEEKNQKEKSLYYWKLAASILIGLLGLLYGFYYYEKFSVESIEKSIQKGNQIGLDIPKDKNSKLIARNQSTKRKIEKVYYPTEIQEKKDKIQTSTIIDSNKKQVNIAPQDHTRVEDRLENEIKLIQDKKLIRYIRNILQKSDPLLSQYDKEKEVLGILEKYSSERIIKINLLQKFGEQLE